jgi:hypothetical protein
MTMDLRIAQQGIRQENNTARCSARSIEWAARRASSALIFLSFDSGCDDVARAAEVASADDAAFDRRYCNTVSAAATK